MDESGYDEVYCPILNAVAYIAPWPADPTMYDQCSGCGVFVRGRGIFDTDNGHVILHEAEGPIEND